MPGGAKGQEKFAARLVDHASRLAEQHGLRAVAILVNRVNTARKAYEFCRKRWPESKADAVCVTGRMRPYDRDRLMSRWRPRLQPDRDRPPLEKPIFVVATQCLEVGANLDFEGMVTECASLDALRQRFGRLKRLGLGPEARGVIAIRADQVKSEEGMAEEAAIKKDPVYGDSLPRTWNWLWAQATQAPANDEPVRRAVDFGIAAMDAIFPTGADEQEPLQAPAAEAPVMLPAHVDCWVQTNPQPEPDPDVSLFLHGPERGEGDVRVCWRADLRVDLPEDLIEDRWVDPISLCTPTAAECMSLPLRVVRDWLRQDVEAQAPDDATSDIEHVSNQEPARGDGTNTPRRLVLRWRGPDDPGSEMLDDLRKLRPGDTLIVPAKEPWARTLGQLPDESGKHSPGWDLDVAELTTRQARRRAVLRLLPDRLKSWPENAATKTLLRIAGEDLEPEDSRVELRQALRDLAAQAELAAELREIVQVLADDRRLKIYRHPDHFSNAPEAMDLDDQKKWFPGGLVLSGSGLLPATGDDVSSADVVTTEDDASSATVVVPLDEHNRRRCRVGWSLRTLPWPAGISSFGARDRRALPRPWQSRPPVPGLVAQRERTGCPAGSEALGQVRRTTSKPPPPGAGADAKRISERGAT